MSLSQRHMPAAIEFPCTNGKKHDGFPEEISGGKNMKKVFLVLTILFGYSLFAVQSAQAQINIAVLHAEADPTWPVDVQSKLQNFPDFGTVDIISVLTSTPTLDQLLAYSAVLVWTDNIPARSGASRQCLGRLCRQPGRGRFDARFDV